MKDRSPVLIANGQGFWGDSILGPVRLVREGPLHYLTVDYLAEVTMSIMQKLKLRAARSGRQAGYATDFVDLMDRILPDVLGKDIRVIANAGGVNPAACRDALGELVRKKGLSGVRIAVVQGDDILDSLPALMEKGEAFTNLDSGEPLAPHVDRVTSANVYLGAYPVAEALDQGAQIVITGRVTDPSLVVGPMIHEFGWNPQDWDRLAAGTVAGHIVECGAQCTGANYARWRDVPDMARIGYPVLEVEPSGEFVVTKHQGTGGLVNRATVASQLMYEMGDPVNYITPDVIADFTTIELAEEGEHRVRVRGVKGRPCTTTYKVSFSYAHGYKAVGELTISGPNAVEKARLCADIIWDRLSMDGVEFPEEDRLVELVGSGVCHQGIVSVDESAVPEVVLRIGARGDSPQKVDRFGREIVPLVTSGPPGVTGFGGGRPKATEVIGYWPALVSKQHVQPQVEVVEY